MNEEPTRPVMIYDGDCAFCRTWIRYWLQLTGERVEYAPFQTAADRFPQIPRSDFEAAVHLMWPDGRVSKGAQAVFQTLALMPNRAWPLWLYDHVPACASIGEWAYRVIAAHRDLFYRLTLLLWGQDVQPATFSLVRWSFLKALGLIYFFAFLSFALQATGLIGSQGILPLGEFLQQVQSQAGSQSYLLLPTIFWFNSGDAFLQIVAWMGVGLSVLLIVGLARRVVVVLLFVGYLSIVNAGQVFLAFQWDVLLLEAGFLAIFIDFEVTIWLYRLLLFRLMFLSGAVKLLSGDPTWHNLTALNYHFETQPLPTVIGWWVHQLPEEVHRLSNVIMFGIELALPFFIFLPRRPRMLAGAGISAFMILILLTGNYAFFSWLTMFLCLFLFDDAALRRFTPQRFIERARRVFVHQTHSRLARWAVGALAAVLITLGVFRLVGTFGGDVPEPIGAVSDSLEPFHLVNAYGLFAVMTTTRDEIIVEGSSDGQTWEAYEFRYKAGDLKRPPLWIAPLQPRLDWQMWFAALSDYQSNPWLVNFAVRLLQGALEVLALVERNPFPDRPPRYIRAVLYDYRFTDPATLNSTGAWWRREPIGLYLPPIALTSSSAN